MIDLAAMFADLESGLAAPTEGNFPEFPEQKSVPENAKHIKNKGISSVSGISSRPQWATVISSERSVRARAGDGAGARARGATSGRLETLETLEKSLIAAGYISSSLSTNLEKKKETENPPALRVLLTLASDPDMQLAFDERAAHLEYECGLTRAEAEAQAADEVLPGLPAARPAPRPVPAAGSDLAAWTTGLARLTPHRAPCPDYRGDEWPRVLANAHAFLDAFGTQAETLGWQTHELFGVHPEVGTVRPDCCGALTLGVGGPVRLETADEIRFGHLTHRRLPGQLQGVPIWEFGMEAQP